MEHEVWQDSPKPARKNRIWILFLLSAAVFAGSALYLMDIPHVDVEKLPGGVQITIGKVEPGLPETQNAEAEADRLPEEEFCGGAEILGITAERLPERARIFYGLPQGLYVSAVEGASAAALSGLREGDIITAVDDTAVEDPESLCILCEKKVPVEFTVYRAGEYQSISVRDAD